MTDESDTIRAREPERAIVRRLFLIDRVTLRFDATEDRLRLDATDKVGLIEGIWLTQRLTNQFVAALAQDLDRELAEGLDEDGKPDPDAPCSAATRLPAPAVAATLHGMEQLRLRLARADVSDSGSGDASSQPAPVARAPETARWLCTTIRLRPTPGGLMISFNDEKSVTARFYMSYRNARAVLDRLADLYRHAQWPLQTFPDWVQDVDLINQQAGQERVLN